MQPIENLQITHFKCFEQLDVSGIGRVNLIGGKNNVGKTAFLEAIELFASSTGAYDLAYIIDTILKRRQNETEHCELDFFYKNKKYTEIFSALKCCRIEWISETANDAREKSSISHVGDSLALSVAANETENKIIIPIHKFTKPNTNKFEIDLWKFKGEEFSYISSAKSKEQDIAILLGKLIDQDRDDFLNKSLSLFDSNIITIKQVTTQYGLVLKLKLKNQDNLVLLSSLGEGVNRYLAILCAIWANKDSFLLIDEIENGIHYTNYKKLWEIIFHVSGEASCQLFVTSHSKECISAFNEAQFESINCHAQYFEFYKNLKTGLITASARDKEQLRYALTHEGRVRGE